MIKYLIITLIILYANLASSQNDSLNKYFNSKFDSIRAKLEKGDKKTLFDLSELLKNQQIIKINTSYGSTTTKASNYTNYILKNYIEFKGFSPDVKNNNIDFNEYLISKIDEISFSEDLKTFFDYNYENNTDEYKINKNVPKNKDSLSLAYSHIIDSLFHINEVNQINDYLNEISTLKTSVSKNYIFSLTDKLLRMKINNNYNMAKYFILSLRYYRDEDSFNKIYEILSEYFVNDYGCTSLALISNVNFFNLLLRQNIEYKSENQFFANYLSYIKNLKDSIGKLDAMREFGYEIELGFGKSDFSNPDDFYLEAIRKSEHRWWIKYNCVMDLISQKNPLALKCISILLFERNKYYKDYIDYESASKINYKIILEELINSVVKVKNAKGNWTYKYEDDVSSLNQYFYWNRHYNDYVWNDEISGFINKAEKLDEPDVMSELFENLYSKDDEVAIKSCERITHYNPVEVKSLLQTFNFDVLSKHNHIIPQFPERAILQLTLFYDYCKKNNYPVDLNERMRNVIDTLSSELEVKDRLHYENYLIDNLTLDDINILEYHTILYQNRKGYLSNSTGRIVNKFYDDKLYNILSDKNQLRLFLKKSLYFYNIRIVGALGHYLLKVQNLPPDKVVLLKDLLKEEEDFDIKNQLKLVLSKYSNASDLSDNFYEYFENIKEIKKESLITVKINENDYDFVFNKLNTESDKDIESKILNVIDANQKIKMIPYLIKSLDNLNIVDKTYMHYTGNDLSDNYVNYDINVCDRVVAILENLTGHTFSEEKEKNTDFYFLSMSRDGSIYYSDKSKTAKNWKKLWEKDSLNYENWGKTFFAKKVKKISTESSVKIDDLMSILNSPYYDTTFRLMILESMKKLNPCEDYRNLYFLKDTLDDKYIDYFLLPCNSCDDSWNVLKNFKKKSPDKIINFFEKFSENFSPVDKGILYTRLLNEDYFDWIMQYPLKDDLKKDILNSLNAYLKSYKKRKSDYEYSSIRSAIYRLTVNKSNIESILNEILKEKSEDAKDILEKFLYAVPYNLLGVILDYYDKLPFDNWDKKAYISYDFGIPIKDTTGKTFSEFKENYKKLSEYDLYCYYLDKSGFDYKDINGKLDFEKIYAILRYGTKINFVGSWDEDVFILPVLRLLQITLKTNLDGQYKFNNMISHFGYTGKSDFNDWCKFLVDKKLVKERKYEPPSIED